MYLRALFLVSLSLVLLISPDVALAQANIFDPMAFSSNDKSMELLSKLFGVLPSFGSSGSDSFSEVVSTFNAAVLTLGGILVSYTILIGTIGTAHDGEMLGKKFSSAWVPIRTAMGTSLVLPVIGGSYCVMQAIVGWLIVQGIGLADSVWSTFMSPKNIENNIIVSMSSQKSDNVVWQIFSGVLCMRTLEKINEDLSTDKETKESTVKLSFGIVNKDSPGEIYRLFGPSERGDGLYPGICGNLSFNKNIFAQTSATQPNDLFGMPELRASAEEAIKKQQDRLNDLITKLDSQASILAQDTTKLSSVVSEVKKLAKNYSDESLANGKSINNQIGKFDKMTESAKRDGWILAGAWYMRMSYVLDQAAKIASYQPNVKPPKNMGAPGEKYEDVFFSKYSTTISELSKMSNNAVGVVDFNNYAQNQKSLSTDSSSSFAEEFSKAFKTNGAFYIDSKSHPIMAMKNLGNTILSISSGAGGAIAASLMGVGWMPGVSGSLTAATSIFTVFGMMIFPPLAAIGFTLSYVLPMMPFMIWIGVTIGWVILCVEAIIAAPMWAVMHLSPHGDDLVGTGAQGYRLVLSLILRPVLMIFGFIASLAIMTVFGQLINEIFMSIFELSQINTNWFIDIVGFIAAGFLYLGLMWTLITKSMDIIHVIPDQLLQWFGGGGPQIGDYGRTFGDKGSSSFAATAAVAGMAGRTIDAAKGMHDIGLQQAQLSKQAGSLEGDKMARATEKLGGSSLGNIMQKIAGVNPGDKNAGSQMEKFANSQEGMQKSAEVNEIVSMLGGSDKQAAQDYLQNLNANLDTMSFREASSEALNSTFNNSGSNQYGPQPQGTISNGIGENQRDFINTLSGGKMNADSIKEAMNYVSSVSDKYKNDPISIREAKTEKFIGEMNKYIKSGTTAEKAYENVSAGKIFSVGTNPSGGQNGDK